MSYPLSDLQVRLLEAALGATVVPAALVRFAATHPESGRLHLAAELLDRPDLPDDLFDLVYQAEVSGSGDADRAISAAALHRHDKAAPAGDIADFLREQSATRAPGNYLRRTLRRIDRDDPLRQALLVTTDAAWLDQVADAASGIREWTLVCDALRALVALADGQGPAADVARTKAAGTGHEHLRQLVERAPKHAARLLLSIDNPPLLTFWLSGVRHHHLGLYGMESHQKALSRAVVSQSLLPVLAGAKTTYPTVESVVTTFAPTWGKGTCRELLAKSEHAAMSQPPEIRAIAQLIHTAAQERLGELLETAPVVTSRPLAEVTCKDESAFGDWLLAEFGDAVNDETQWPAIMAIVDSLGPDATASDVVCAVRGVTRSTDA